MLVQQERETKEDLDLMLQTEPAFLRSDEPRLCVVPDHHLKGNTNATSSLHKDLA